MCELLLSLDLVLTVINVLGFTTYRRRWASGSGVTCSAFYFILTLLFAVERLIRCLLVNEQHNWYRDVLASPPAHA